MTSRTVEILVTDEFKTWFFGLNESDWEAVVRNVHYLELLGSSLGYPRSSALKGTRHPIRELRVQSGGRPIRVFYAFDPKRNAVLLLGGHKTGKGFYREYIPIVERIWEEYLREQENESLQKEDGS